jgi:hypothetical protein
VQPASPKTVFALPDRLAAKSDRRLIAIDEDHFAALAAHLARSVADLSERLVSERRSAGGRGQAALDRDLQIHRLTARLRTLQRYGLDVCLGRIVPADGGPPVYVGRVGLADGAGGRLLVDWRSPAAEPFFGATHANPMGLASRRRYRWTDGRISDYWDEVFVPGALAGHVALDDQSAFVASLGAARTGRMRDVLATIQADQDAIIRAGSGGVLVVDGGPGTGKTVVALHRAAYLLFTEPRLDRRHGGVLFVGPHEPYLAYVADVLPGLGEDGVRMCMPDDLVPESADVGPDDDCDVARLKATARLVEVIDAAARLYEEPPADSLCVHTEWGNVTVAAADWAEAFSAPDPGTPHNDGRELVWNELVAILLGKLMDGIEEDAPEDTLRAALQCNRTLLSAFGRAWPLLDAADLVADLWSVPAYLRRCAPWLSPDEVRALQREVPAAWTSADLPWLDVARHRLGDPERSRRTRRREAAVTSEQARRAMVIDDIIAADDDVEGAVTMLRGADLREALVSEPEVPRSDPGSLAGPFAHIVVDEAQELTDAQWQMLVQRCPSGSFTVVGDRAQARHRFAESWTERLERIGLGRVRVASLRINYRTPEEVMSAAEPVIRAALPDANVPTSVRSSGVPVTYGPVSDLASVLADRGEDEGTTCVIGAAGLELPTRTDPRIRLLTPELAKGLEFDVVVVVEPEWFGAGIEGAVDRYVAMTRATRRLVVLT